MANITREQLKTIIQKAPPGTSPQQVVDALKTRGHTVGVAQQLKAPTQKKSIAEKVAGFGEGFVPLIGTFARITQLPLYNKLQKDLTKEYVEMGGRVAEHMKREDVSRERKEKIFQLYKDSAPEVIKQHPDFDKTFGQVMGEALVTGASLLPAAKVGQITKAKTATQAFISGAKAVAPAGAVIGATTGVGEALRNEDTLRESFERVAISTVSGAVTSALFGGLFAKKQFNAPIKASKLREKAIKSYQSGLSVTKEKYKQKSKKIIPELLDRGWWGSRKKLMDKAQKGLTLNRKQYQALGELQGVVETDGLTTLIREEMEKLTTPAGRVISVNRSKHKALKDLLEDVISLQAGDEIGTMASQQTLRELAGDYGEALYETRKSFKTISDSATLSQVKKVDSEIRTLLNTKNPKFEAINKVYHVNSELYDVLQETAQRQGGQKWLSLTRILTFGFGLTTGRTLEGAVAGGLGLPAAAAVLNSSWFRTLSATHKWKLADKLMKMSSKELPKMIALLARGGVEIANQILDEQ